MKPGPVADPRRRLRDAAIEFACAVEAEGDTTAEWDRLRKAAIHYRDSERPAGRIPTASHPGGSGPRPAETERERRSAEGPAVSASLDRETA